MEGAFKKRMKDKTAGGLYGMLIGDALGVPYEFHKADELPPYEDIEMTPPAGFKKAHNAAAGTWSDDGAQALCLLDSLLSCGGFRLKDFADRVLAWYEEGLWAIDGVVFDVGVQTSEALWAYRTGTPPEKCGFVRPEGKGNGALMRVLPLVLFNRGTNRELVMDAHSQCLITHGHPCNQVCCALYCLTGRYLLEGADFGAAVKRAVTELRKIYGDSPMYAQELEWSIHPEEVWEGGGSGYVVDCLRSAFMIMERAADYEDAVRRAVLLGDDTDTTACVTGGLAGIAFGFQNIPKRWYDTLKGKEGVEGLLHKLCEAE